MSPGTERENTDGRKSYRLMTSKGELKMLQLLQSWLNYAATILITDLSQVIFEQKNPQQILEGYRQKLSIITIITCCTRTRKQNLVLNLPLMTLKDILLKTRTTKLNKDSWTLLHNRFKWSARHRSLLRPGDHPLVSIRWVGTRTTPKDAGHGGARTSKNTRKWHL